MNTITIQQIGGILVRAIALLLFLYMSSAVGAVIYALLQDTESTLVKVLSILPYALLLLFSILLWFKAPYIANRMVCDTASTPAPFTIENLQIVLLATLGVLLFIAKAFPAMLMLMAELSSLESELQKILKMLGAFFYLGASLLLIFKPQVIARLTKY